MRRYDDPDPYDPLTEGGINVDQGGGMYGGPNPPDPPQVDTGKDKAFRRSRGRGRSRSGGPIGPFSSDWFMRTGGRNLMTPPAGVPTAEQEALRDPRVDPVFMLAGGVSGGLERAGEHMLLRQSIIDNLMRAFPDAARSDFAGAMGSAVPRWAAEFAKGMIRPIAYGATSQALLGNPNHPAVAHYGSLPVGGNATAYTARLSDYAQEMANKIPKLPGE